MLGEGGQADQGDHLVVAALRILGEGVRVSGHACGVAFREDDVLHDAARRENLDVARQHCDGEQSFVPELSKSDN